MYLFYKYLKYVLSKWVDIHSKNRLAFFFNGSICTYFINNLTYLINEHARLRFWEFFPTLHTLFWVCSIKKSKTKCPSCSFIKPCSFISFFQNIHTFLSYLLSKILNLLALLWKMFCMKHEFRIFIIFPRITPFKVLSKRVDIHFKNRFAFSYGCILRYLF